MQFLAAKKKKKKKDVIFVTRGTAFKRLIEIFFLLNNVIYRHV